MTGDFNRQRQAVSQQLAALFESEQAGQPEPQPVTPRAEEVRARVLALVNGAAPDSLKLPPAAPRRDTLEIEAAALDQVLSVFSQREIIARVAEAELYVSQHGDDWIADC